MTPAVTKVWGIDCGTCGTLTATEHDEAAALRMALAHKEKFPRHKMLLWGQDVYHQSAESNGQ